MEHYAGEGIANVKFFTQEFLHTRMKRPKITVDARDCLERPPPMETSVKKIRATRRRSARRAALWHEMPGRAAAETRRGRRAGRRYRRYSARTVAAVGPS